MAYFNQFQSLQSHGVTIFIEFFDLGIEIEAAFFVNR